MSLLETLNRITPRYCRLYARKLNGRRPLSHAEIAKLANISKAYVAELSFRDSWKGVSVDVADRFARACGVDLLHPGPAVEYLQQSKMAHVLNSSRGDRQTDQSQARFYKRLLSGATAAN
jgi:ribulose 1,5-bisphosphate carboxylase large subunit-like protein